MNTSRRSATALFLAAAATLALSACGGDDGGSTGATMRPGEDCVACHSNFTLAGTIYAAGTMQGVGGVDVAVTDGAGTHHCTSNSVGNFFTTEALTFPVGITVSRGAAPASMNNASSGACNSCHDVSMRITVP